MEIGDMVEYEQEAIRGGYRRSEQWKKSYMI